MKKPRRTRAHKLPACIVHASANVNGRELDAHFAGCLLFATRQFVVLVNHINDEADFGPLKTRRDRHVTPECHVTVIPRRRVARIEMLKVS